MDKQIHPEPTAFNRSEQQGYQGEHQEVATSNASFPSHSNQSYIGGV